MSHVESTPERQALSASSRLTVTFNCKSIVVSKEIYTSLGHHYHVGIRNENASKHSAVSMIRRLFPEFEGRQLNVSFHKGWNSICSYLLKEDKSPVVWGEESLELIRERAQAHGGKRQGPDLAKLLRGKSSWDEVMMDDNLVRKCLSSYSSVRNTFMDLQAMKQKVHVLERLAAYVKEKGGEAYTPIRPLLRRHRKVK